MEKLTKAKFSNLKKILYPQSNITKSQVIKYYIKIAPKILPYLKDRPLVTTRYPNGIKKDGFYEKDAPKGTPSWVQTYNRYSKTHLYQKPDIILFDIDPEPPANINDAIQTAQKLKEILDNLSLRSYPKTSGKKGLHIIIPIIPEYTYKQTREFVHHIGKHLAKENEMIVSEFSESRKPGTVYIDYLQNSSGKTMVSPYSLRAEKEAPISIPLAWKQLQKGLKPAHFNIFSVIHTKSNPWKDFWKQKQKLDV